MSTDVERAVVFDLDGTLVDFDREYASVVYEATDEHMGVRDEAFVVTYSDRFLELLGEQVPSPYERAFEHALAESGYDEAGVDVPAMVDSLLEAEIEALEVVPGVETVLGDLADREVGVGVLTNGVTAWQQAKFESTGLDQFVDAFTASYEAGAHKPDERAFELAAERVPGESYVMVGDSFGADVEGATAMGWRAVHYDPSGESAVEESETAGSEMTGSETVDSETAGSEMTGSETVDSETATCVQSFDDLRPVLFGDGGA